MILITSIELPEFVRTKAAFLLAVTALELPSERVLYCGASVCGQEVSF